MKRCILLFTFLIVLLSCESNKDKCVRRLIDEKGYNYDDACEACEEMANDSSIR